MCVCVGHIQTQTDTHRHWHTHTHTYITHTVVSPWLKRTLHWLKLISWRLVPLLHQNKKVYVIFLNTGKPTEKHNFLSGFFPSRVKFDVMSINNWDALSTRCLDKLASSAGCHASVTADQSWSRLKPVSNAKSFDLWGNADQIHRHCRQEPDVSGVFDQWKRDFTP